jgi:hypothetical protein
VSEPRQTPPALSGQGTPCPNCGAALAADQRYCLNCGVRRGGPRVDYREHLNGNGAVAGAAEPKAADPAPVAAPAATERRQRDYAPLAAAGGIAVLGIMLLIGVLIGRGTGSSEPASPQVVTVPAAQSSGETAESAGEGEGGDSAKAKSGKASGKQGGKDDVVAGGSSDTGNAPVASDDQLQQLQEQSPEEYQDSSAKLPDEIATPGKAPPTDDKAPGGGSGGTTIE